MHFIGNMFNTEIVLVGTRPNVRQRSATATGNPISFPWALHCHISPVITLPTVRETLKRLPVPILNLVTTNQGCLDTGLKKIKNKNTLFGHLWAWLLHSGSALPELAIAGGKWKSSGSNSNRRDNNLGIPVSPESTASVLLDPAFIPVLHWSKTKSKFWTLHQIKV